MNTKEWLDSIDDSLKAANAKTDLNKWNYLNMAAAELSRLSGIYSEADCFHVHLNPAIQTVSGTRSYDLPSNFGLNFIRGAGDDGSKFVCMLDNGSMETPLTYKSTSQFYSQNLTGESSGTPGSYTIITIPGGRKQLVLGPTPDDSYEVNGIYTPTDWDLITFDSIPPLPGNSAILKFAVLKQIDPNRWLVDYQREEATLALEFAKNKKTKMVPKMGSEYQNSWTLM